MGGVSESAFQIQPTGSETGEATGLFKGDLVSFILVYKFYTSLISLQPKLTCALTL
jgi:hypothetical protein